MVVIGCIPPDLKGGSGLCTRYPPKLIRNLLYNFSAYFSTLRHIPPASVFHKLMPRYYDGSSEEVRVKSSLGVSTLSHITGAKGKVMRMSPT